MFCPVCRFPSINGVTHPRCGKNMFLDGLYVTAHFSGPVKKAIHLLKYRFVYDLTRELVDTLIKKLPDSFKAYDFLLPVPLHPKKESERGFNQSYLIAKVISEKLGIPVFRKIIKRIKYTKPQYGLNIKDRKLNLKGVFSLSKGAKIQNKKIIIVDDVATTFSTLKECSKELKKAGAASVFALVLAHGN